MRRDAEGGLVPRQGKPAGWKDVVFTRSWTFRHDRAACWGWLQDPRTFTRQVWPFRVEFVEGTGVYGGGGFEVGTLNVHHGPLLNAAGVITMVNDGEDGQGKRRDLHYTYGSFVIGMRFARPTLLRFDVADAVGGGTVVSVRLESFAAGWFAKVWEVGLRSFWGLFGWSMDRGVRKRIAREGGRIQPRS